MVGGGYFPSKTGVGHGSGHLDAILGVGRVVCIKQVDFCFVAIFARWTAHTVAIFTVDAAGQTSTTCGIPQTTTVDGSVRQERQGLHG